MWVKPMTDDLPDRLRKLVHPIISSSLALLAIRLDEECGDKELRWTSPLVSSHNYTPTDSADERLSRSCQHYRPTFQSMPIRLLPRPISQ